MNDYLMHYGVGHLDGGNSGRWPWGSGSNPCQREMDFLSSYERYKAKNLTEKEIAEKLGVLDRYGKPSARALRAKVSTAKDQVKTAQVSYAREMANQGKTSKEIAKSLGKPESTVRGWLDESRKMTLSASQQTADALKTIADKKRFVDISAGAEVYLGVTKNRLEQAKYLLMEQGYNVYTIKIPQIGSNNMTTITTLAPPDVSYSEAVENRFEIKPVYNESKTVDDRGATVSYGLSKDLVRSISPDRIKVVYNEEGGVDKDGLIEIRPGVPDISIGDKRYAQIRMAVNDTHYLKGMAVYKDGMPPGVDIIFNTNKHTGTPVMGEGDETVLKPLKKKADGSVNWEYPFGASVTLKEDGGKTSDGKPTYSAACIVNEEGEWQKWSRNLSSQFGSKQPVTLIDRQLKLDAADRKAEFEAICALENPTVRRHFLLEFADKCDTAAVELKAAPFPRQQQHVLIPDPRIKDGEIYAPNYPDGTKVVLVRHPYAGPFESPLLTVRNKGSVGKDIIGANAPDAVVINKTAANQMSGADFDGDTVSVMPLSDKVKVRTRPPLEGLKDFDPSERYPKYPGMEVISSQQKQMEMGKVTNLITDMTLKNAPESDIVRAVKHSMVIIDSEKHELDWKRSELENGIAELKATYQRDPLTGREGAGSIISRAKSPADVPERKQWTASSKSIGPDGEKIYSETGSTYTTVKLKGTKEVNPETGKLRTVYPEEAKAGGWIGTWEEKSTGRLYYTKLDASGKKVRVYLGPDDYTATKVEKRTQESTRMAEASDPYTLTSGGSKENPGYPAEKIYARYASEMKALGNLARKTWLTTAEDRKDPAAAKLYAEEVRSLMDKLQTAQAHSPKERQAQMMANRTMAVKRHDNPGMTKDQAKKAKQQAIESARHALGVKKKDSLIQVTDAEWEAIQHKAISPSKLSEILRFSDPDVLRKKATPREQKSVSSGMMALAKSMAASGYTNADIAERLGVSATTVSKILNGKQE